MKRLKVGIIGLGSQGSTYVRNEELYKTHFQLVAIADINADLVRDFGTRHNVPESGWYYSDNEMFEAAPNLDIVYICTRDKNHHDEAMRALSLGWNVLLEKPAGINEEECLDIKQKAEESGKLVVICHVLRYAPAFAKIKEWISGGYIGELLTIQAKEQISAWHMAHSFVRGNCGNTEKSSPLFLQKCCHDMDLLSWYADRKPVKLSSFAHLTHFKGENAPVGAPMRCTDGCPTAEHCPYNAVRYYYEHGICFGLSGWPYEMVVPVNYTEENMLKALQKGPYGRCVYHCDNDAVDHQVVNIEFEGGLLVSFTMSAFTTKNGRVIHIMGSKGEILADFDDGKYIELIEYGDAACASDAKHTRLSVDMLTKAGNCGHGGGEDIMLTEMYDAISNNQMSSDLTSIQNSIDSHLICLAAQKSADNDGEVVYL